MNLVNRTQAGKMLASKLHKYKKEDAIVYALPRGGVVTAVEIAKDLLAPLDLVNVRKITHPSSPEYAIAVVDEFGRVLGNRKELLQVDEDWLENEVEIKRREAESRRALYFNGRRRISASGKVAIIVDDGVATGLTLRAGIEEVKKDNPLKIIVAVPIVPKSTAAHLKQIVDEFVSLITPSDAEFLGAVGSYYENFQQVSDTQVIRILDEHTHWLEEVRWDEYDKRYSKDYLF